VNRRILLSWFFFHFALLLVVSLNQTVRLISSRLTNIPRSIERWICSPTSAAEGPLELGLPKTSMIRQLLLAYLTCGGADAGYGYFAPNIPSSYELSFELRAADGQTELLSLQLGSSDLGLRVASLVDQIGGTPSPELREHMLKKMAAVVSRRYPQVKTMRILLSQTILPTLEEYARGKRRTAVLLYAYDFGIRQRSALVK
jgi:hypothetical protein